MYLMQVHNICIFWNLRSITSFLSSGFSNPAEIKPNLHAYLVDQDMWETMEPNYKIIFSILFLSFLITISLVVVRYKTRHNTVTTTTEGKYKNPLRNISFVILVVIVVFTTMQWIFFQNTYSIFPRFSLGCNTTVMLFVLLTGNPASRKYAKR